MLVFSVEPSTRPSGTFVPSVVMARATMQVCAPKRTPSIINATTSSSERSAAISSPRAVSVAATKRRDTADFDVDRAGIREPTGSRPMR